MIPFLPVMTDVALIVTDFPVIVAEFTPLFYWITGVLIYILRENECRANQESKDTQKDFLFHDYFFNDRIDG